MTVEPPSYTVHLGDTRRVLATMEPDSVDLVLSSPPFLGLRSYLPDDDPAKIDEMGSEATPGEFIEGLLDVVEACERVLAPHGTLAFELGDTYSGSGGAGGDFGSDGLRDGQEPFEGSAKTARANGGDTLARRAARKGYGGAADRVDALKPGTRSRVSSGEGWPLDKSLCLIPEIFRFSLVYGFNPLTGRQTPRWRARNVVRWVRPNPPVGALGDKFRPATSDLLIICKAQDRYFDLDAVRTGTATPPGGTTNFHPNDGRDPRGYADLGGQPNTGSHPAGAPPLDWWKISPKGYPGAHYATFPAELLLRPIKAMCPERVCTTCGAPARRIVDTSYVDAAGRPAPAVSWPSGIKDGKGAHSLKKETRTTTTTTTTGWTDCGHDTWRPGIVLDPFVGSGTTLVTAFGLNRSAVGIDLDRRNLPLIQDRFGMFPVEVVDHLAPQPL